MELLNTDMRNNKKHIYGKIDNISEMLSSTIYSIKSYYSETHTSVTRPNMLVTLIESLGIDYALPVTDIYIQLDATSSYTINDFNIVNNLTLKDTPNTGVVMESVNEYLLYVNEPFDMFNSKYEDITPVKCIYNTFTELMLTHPKKYTDGISDIDTAIYTVDPVKLGIQYYYWRLEQIEFGNDTDPARFVYEVVLVNAIDSIVHISLFNRYMSIYHDDYLAKTKNYNPIYTKDFSSSIDKLYRIYIKQLHKNNHMLVNDLLGNIPLLHNKVNMYDTFKLPDNTNSRKTTWVLWLARIDYLIFIIDIMDAKLNKDWLNDIAITLAHHKRQRYFEVMDNYTDSLLSIKLDMLEIILKEKQ